ncbi:hypothetical protein TI03_02360 [Achromatium sp. WMS1]|nr:hypothetical protein TI03_02360 [Achromatium sp. WMS1]
MIEALPPELNRELAEATSVVEVEQLLNELNTRNLNATLKNSRSAIGRALAYLMLRDLDFKRLVTVVQRHLLKLDNNLLYQALGLQIPDVAAPPTTPLPTAA